MSILRLLCGPSLLKEPFHPKLLRTFISGIFEMKGRHVLPLVSVKERQVDKENLCFKGTIDQISI